MLHCRPGKYFHTSVPAIILLMMLFCFVPVSFSQRPADTSKKLKPQQLAARATVTCTNGRTLIFDPSSNMQVLNEKGKEENRDLQR